MPNLGSGLRRNQIRVARRVRAEPRVPRWNRRQRLVHESSGFAGVGLGLTSNVLFTTLSPLSRPHVGEREG